MNLIDRYISAVAQQLPDTRRDDITRELKANILDRIESLAREQGRAATSSDESIILSELGHPQRVAASFLPPRTLVNAEWFPLFKQCLSYGLIFTFALQLIDFCVAFVSFGKVHINGFLGGLLHSYLIMFASVTAVFYLLSNLPNMAQFSPYRNWKPEQLPPITQPWQHIKPLDSACDFATLVFFLLILQRDLWMPKESFTQIPIHFGTSMQPWITPLSIWALFFIAFNLWNLRFSFWSQSKLLLNIAMNLFGSAVAFILINIPNKIILIEQAKNPFNSTALAHINLWLLVGVGCFCLFDAGRSGYRFYLLKMSA